MNGQAAWRLTEAHPATEGHFPGNPIIPGVVLLQGIVAAIAAQLPGMICRKIVWAKFLQPVRPGARVSLAWDETPSGDIRFTCAEASGGSKVVTGALRFGPP